MREKLKRLESLSIEPLVMRLLSAWCLSAVLFLILSGDFRDLENFSGFGLISFVAVFAAFTVAQYVAAILMKKKGRVPERVLLPVSFGLYSFLTVSGCTDDMGYYYVFALTAFWAILLFYYNKRGWLRFKKAMTKKKMVTVIAVSGGVFFLLVGLTGALRYAAYRTPNYDFGIFCQMFYNLKRHLTPVTTCERDRLLSHFAVHLSLIYYLMLPVYFVFSSPVTLQLTQAALLGSAVIPLSLLCRHYKLSYLRTAVFAVVLVAFPAVAGGTNYDFHENCFLLPLLLWVFWAYEKEKHVLTAVFTLLTLFVKEDAAIYIAFFAIYVLLDRKKYLRGVLLLAGAGIYFLVAVKILSSYGEGVMTTRYENFIVGDGTLLDAVKNVLVDPGYAFTQIFVDGDGSYQPKMLFLLQIAVPLAFLPFGVKRPSRLLLLLPMLLMNFLTLYVYQYQIGFQYTFGVIAFLFYLSVINVSDMQPATGRLLLSIACVCGVMCFILSPVSRCSYYLKLWAKENERNELISEALDEIPEDKSVVCSTFLLPHLANREVLYETYYHQPADGEKLDYVILDYRMSAPTEDKEKYEALGYQVTKTVEYEGNLVLEILQ
ncbi:MAG: DUF2079 domain-containing protein [Clostridia bacterium]|nr:DUF2079 domain-containing protein [Clostridia bacterium]